MPETHSLPMRSVEWPEDMKGVAAPDTLPALVAYEIGAARARNARLHFAIMHEPFLDALLSGTKTVESRFSRHRIDPWMRAAEGDLVMVARSGGIVVGYFVVRDVKYYDIGVSGLAEVRQRFSAEICSQLDPLFWETRAATRYVTLLGVESATRCDEFRLRKRDQRAWISFDWQRTLV